ncbi:hypothetical protein AAZX31_17G087300 [Glycine max]
MLSLEISQTKTKTLLFGSTTSLECFKRVIAIAHQKGTDDSLKFIW